MVLNRQNRHPFTFWQNLAIFGPLFKVNFLENYTSNQADTKLKTCFKA